jgi:DNA-directed RNA polymerase II subunit RPB1
MLIFVSRVYQSDPTFADRIRHIREPKARLAAVWNFCKSKGICELDEPKEEEEPVEEPTKKGHGGCGHIQPSIRKEGLKLFLNYKKSRDDDEVCKMHKLLWI